MPPWLLKSMGTLDVLLIGCVSAEKAELSGSQKVEQNHVKIAQHQIEADQMTPVIAKLPNQQKIVLAAILINEKNGLKNIQTGEVYSIYSQACRHLGTNALTQRRVSGLDLQS